MLKILKRLLKSGKVLHSNISWPQNYLINIDQEFEGKNYLIYGSTIEEGKIAAYIKANISLDGSCKVYGSLLTPSTNVSKNAAQEKIYEIERLRYQFDRCFIIASEVVFESIGTNLATKIPLIRIDPSVLINPAEFLLNGGTSEKLNAMQKSSANVISASKLRHHRAIVAFADNWRAAPHVVAFYLEYVRELGGRYEAPNIFLVCDKKMSTADYSLFLEILYAFQIPYKKIFKKKLEFFKNIPSKENYLWICGQHRAGFVRTLTNRMYVYKEDYSFVKEELLFDKSRFFHYLNRSIESMEIPKGSDLYYTLLEWEKDYHLYEVKHGFYFPNIRALLNSRKEKDLALNIQRELYDKIGEYYNL